MPHDIVARLRIDPGQRTFGQLTQDREAAALEIERLRAQIDRPATRAPRQSFEQTAPPAAKSAIASKEPPFRPGALIRLAEVCRFLSISRSTVYKKLSEKSFPGPVRLGMRTVRWRIEDIEAWRDGDAPTIR